MRGIGIVWPSPPDQGDIDETRRFMPDSVTLHMVGTKHAVRPEDEDGITLERLLRMPGDRSIEETARELSPFDVQAISYACTSASYVRGVGGDVDISDRIAAATGLPATTTSSASVAALRRLGVRRVSVLSPHIDEMNERLKMFLEGSGLDVLHMRGLNKLGGIEDIPSGDIRRLVLRLVDRPDADGVFVSCTSMRTASIIDSMEDAIGKPVVSALQATVWESLRLAGLWRDTPGLGRLYRA